MGEVRGVEFNQLCVKIAHGRTDGAADGGGTADERRKTSAHVLISQRDVVEVGVAAGVGRGGARGAKVDGKKLFIR